MARPLKNSIAVVAKNANCVLAVRRSDDDEELPGIWGLPAGTFRDGETPADLIRRIGNEKLGVSLSPVRKLAEGTQDRKGYRLEMTLWEVNMEGTPSRPEWQWAEVEILKPGREKGSLCCDLAGWTRG